MKTMVSLLLIVSLIAATAGCTQYHAQGAAAGGAVGGVAGALLDSKNPWRGGVIGAALGAVFGATITDVSMRANQESVQANRPVEYRTTDGRGVYRADPLPVDEQTRCKKVRERVWENDRLVKDQVREVCEGERYERRY
jgi:outer membrane lipoprotein SlyB